MSEVKIEILSDSEEELPVAGPSASDQEGQACSSGSGDDVEPARGPFLLSALRAPRRASVRATRGAGAARHKPKPNGKQRKLHQEKLTCSVKHCTKNTHTHKFSFFPMPEPPDSPRAVIWRQYIKKYQQRQQTVVCQAHFEKRFIKRVGGECRLTDDAVPTLRLPHAYEIHKAQKLHQVPRRHRVTRKQDSNNLIRVIAQENKFRKKKITEKYTDEYKFAALQLYVTSPATYRVVQTCMNLPSISVLNRLFIPSISKVNENVIKGLKLKVKDMDLVERECCISIGSVRLKQELLYNAYKDQVIGFHDVNNVQKLEVADTVVVMMVRGVLHDWSQALLVAFLAQGQDYSDLRTLIKDTILQLLDIKLNVCALVSDIESDFIGIVQHYNITVDQPYFKLKDHLINFMYDSAHLLKALRDDFCAYDIHWSNKVAKWQHIKDCCKLEKNKGSFKLAPNLTLENTSAPNELTHKEKLQIAEKTLCVATATAISTYIDLQVIDESSKDTVEWLTMVVNAFDIIRPGGNKSYDGGKVQNQILDSVFNTLQDLHLTDKVNGTGSSTKNSQFIRRLQLTIVSLKSLHGKVLVQPKTFKYLDTDCVTLFFDKVQKSYGALPTAQQVATAVNTFPISNLFNYKVNRKIVDLEKFSEIVNKITDTGIPMYSNKDTEAVAADKASQRIDLNSVELPSENAMSHLAAWLLFEGYRHHSECEKMKSYVFNKKASTLPVIFKKTVLCGPDSNVFLLVRQEFIEFVESMEVIFKLYFETEVNQRHPLEGLKHYLLVDSVKFMMPCKCFPIDFIKFLYIRYRLHILFKHLNNKITTDDYGYFMINELTVQN